jgi:ABC-2 type transport system ATP-binding protein
MIVIEASNLTKRYGDVVAINDLTFSVEHGEIFGFLGPNGAGKTTAVRMLTGLLKPDSGTVFIEDLDLAKDSIKAKMKVGMAPETGNVYVDLTPKQNLSLIGKYYGLPKNRIQKRSDKLLLELGLYERRNDLVKTFSKGMKQRVSIACAIIHEPDILFLDEPTSGLDVQSRRLILKTIKDMNGRGCTIFLTTHDIEEANKLCHRVCIINKGKIVAMDKPEKLRETIEKTKSLEVSFDMDIAGELFNSELISRIDRQGNKWRFYTTDVNGTIRHIVTIAENNELKIDSITTYGPSLEEVFVRLTEVMEK